jgi:hypothetical protein
MAAIPEEAFPRFLAELPEMVGMLRHMLSMNEALEALGAKITPQSPTWVDDDKRTGTVTLHADGEEIASVKVKLPPKQERAK